MNEVKTKKYFLNDSEINKIEDDKFNQKDVVKNIKTLIDNTMPPFNVALIGKFGGGKSSTINMLLNDCKEDLDKYNVHKINVWKENIALKKFLESEIESNSIDEQSIEEINSDSIVNDIKVEDGKNKEIKNERIKKQNNKVFNFLMDMCNAIIIFVACLFFVSILFCFIEYFQNIEIYNQNSTFFVENTYVNYCENLGPILLISVFVSIIGIIISKIGNKKDKSNVEENKYNNINNKEEVNDNDEVIDIIDSNSVIQHNKNIIIIEDIDKLSISKMVEVLDELKYNNYNNCICIVPFDESILRKAVEEKNTLKLNENYKVIEIEDLIDKLFQYKIYLSPISYCDIKNYALDIVQENIPDFITEYCSIEMFEKIIKNILIYKYVTTPRHIKKLINNFVNNKIIAFSRYESGKLEENIVKSTQFNIQLAKISVIQSDFNDFYNVLFKDYNYLNKLIELYNLDKNELKANYKQIDDNLKPFLTTKYRALKSFLKQTERFGIDDVETLIYLTKIETQKMFGNIRVLDYIKGEEDISNLSLEDILKLVKLIDKKEELKEFSINNIKKIIEIYNNNATNERSFTLVNEIINIINKYIEEQEYLNYLEIVAINYNYYPDKALQVFKDVEIEIPSNIMVVLFEKLKDNLSNNTYEDSFKIIKDNCEFFYEENGNVSDYVQFLVNYIAMSSNPNEVIIELDENFNRIGKVYELNKNIKGLQGIDYNRAYAFLAKCLDNGDLDRMVYVINTILSDEQTIQDCLKIEEKLQNYSLIDVIEYDVDYITELEENDNQENTDNSENIMRNYTLLRNLLELCANKQEQLNSVDVMKIVEKSLSNVNDSQYIISIYSILEKFDRMYFYEIRRDFNEVIYSSFHTGKNNAIKEAALECTRYFKTTRLFITKLTPEEQKFYSEN